MKKPQTRPKRGNTRKANSYWSAYQYTHRSFLLPTTGFIAVGLRPPGPTAFFSSTDQSPHSGQIARRRCQSAANDLQLYRFGTRSCPWINGAA
jgi:hypothetical protein